MRCPLRRALPAVLILAVAPTAVFAQSLVCHTLRRGDTASHAARRLTGNGRNKYQPWFQIVAPSGSFVPKSQYDRLRPGWRACVVTRSVDSRSRKATHIEAAESAVSADTSTSIEPAAAPERAVAVEDTRVLEASVPLAPVGLSARDADLTVFWLGAAIAVPWVGWRIVDDALDRRRRAAFAIRHFADRFVREFERPLIQHHAADRPLRVEFRRNRFGTRFDILLAPGASRRYPNLSDHKQNVEYDVTRVLQVLADDSFVTGPLRAHAEWVVVPFQFKQAGPKPRV